jgi:hypothetical protein
VRKGLVQITYTRHVAYSSWTSRTKCIPPRQRLRAKGRASQALHSKPGQAASAKGAALFT